MKLYYLENNKSVEKEASALSFEKSFDVIVVGLGTAGSIALITAGIMAFAFTGLAGLI